jgi:asparagine synthase (glutamine-hydrolysing)
LSGGLDSTLISALYSSVSNKKIDTFSIGYDEFKEYDELEYARLASSSIGSNHHEFIVSKTDFIDAFEEILEGLDEPINDSAIIPTFMLSREVHKNGYKVVLSGEGSDEIFFGYDAYFDYLKMQTINNELSQGSKDFLAVYHQQNPNLSRNWEFLRRVYKTDLPIFRATGECFNSFQKSKLLNFNCEGTDEQIKKIYSLVASRDIPFWMSYIDIKHWIGEVLMTKMDRMSMAHSLESRAPFLDYRLVEFVMSLPSELRVGSETKTLLKKVAVKYIPKKIAYRQKKGFSSPHFEWYYETYGDKILDDFRLVNKQLGWFDDEFLTFLYKQGKIGKFKQHTWGLIVFCRWFMKRFM